MTKVSIAIGVTTFYLMVYAMTPSLGFAYDIVFALFLVGNPLFLYMVYAILKYGEEPKEKWSDGHWYSDMDRTYSKDA